MTSIVAEATVVAPSVANRAMAGKASTCRKRMQRLPTMANCAQSMDRDAARPVFDHLAAKGPIDGNRRYGEAHPGLYAVAFTLER